MSIRECFGETVVEVRGISEFEVFLEIAGALAKGEMMITAMSIQPVDEEDDLPYSAIVVCTWSELVVSADA